jgi:TIR domain
MSGAIFISYRRDDSEGEAGRLYDDLVHVFHAPGAVFMDVSDIHPGKDFRKAIDENVSKSAVLLAIIGPAWATIKDASGARRIDQPNDFVRLEIASAMTRGIDVIPVLVHGARMPNPAELPEDLQNLAYRNGVELTHARWNSDVVMLTRALRDYVHHGDALATRTIRNAITGEIAAVDPVAPAPAPETRSFFSRVTDTTKFLVLAAFLGSSTFVYISQKLKHHEKEEAKKSEQTGGQGQAANDGSTSAPGAASASSARPAAIAATPASNTSQGAPSGSTPPALHNPLAGTWVANQWHTAARSSIPIGTPVEFEIAQHGDVFAVDMFASVGSALMWCGKQSIPLTNHGLSSTWDEAASPSCSKYPGMYTANTRLYMIDTRLHMIVWGKNPSTGIDFDRIQ